MKKKDSSKAMTELHSRAEERLKKKGGKAGTSTPESDIHRLYHELQVHQIELEMQNDELRRAQAKLEGSRSQYEFLYDFSPVGYLTFDRKGLIESINLPGAALLGFERQRLLKAPFSRFIQPDSVKVFLSHLEQVFTTGTKQICELWLNIKDNRRLLVAMESIRVEFDDGDPVQCHSAIMDITAQKQTEEALHRAHTELERRVEERTIELRTALSEIVTLKEKLEAENIYFRHTNKMTHRFEHILGQSDGLKYALYRAEQVAPGNTTVLILGETGTGKELIAFAIHDMSPRKERALITVNCAALPGNLIESELFGR
ncbi:MAG: sigma 54-interacting transcriptional regulator, partial [Syntrophales bacterium]